MTSEVGNSANKMVEKAKKAGKGFSKLLTKIEEKIKKDEEEMEEIASRNQASRANTFNGRRTMTLDQRSVGSTSDEDDDMPDEMKDLFAEVLPTKSI